MAFKNVGKAVPRLEGAEKVSGVTRYAADIDVPGALLNNIDHLALESIEKHPRPRSRFRELTLANRIAPYLNLRAYFPVFAIAKT
jgi:CO/xanthine dehydrogenase Mo-binding subunit